MVTLGEKNKKYKQKKNIGVIGCGYLGKNLVRNLVSISFST